MKARLGQIFAVLLLLAIVSVPAWAQEVASITGTVNDKSGGAISDASLKLTDTRTGSQYSAKTSGDGSFRFLRLSPGPGYALNVTKDGFQSVTISNLYLPVGSVTTQNVQLEVGPINQTVEVKSEGSVSLDTTDATIGNNFDMRAIASLPNEFRTNPANLLRLEPGVVSAQSAGGAPGGSNDPSGSRDGSVTGARADQNNIMVDGIDATDFAIGQAFTAEAAIPVDAIQEFRTEVSNPTADEGRGSGAQTVITTKGGTNDWHGSAREYNRNTVTEANTFFNNKSGIPRSGLIRNQFGADLGGPIKKDKLFFFFDYEGRRDASQINEVAIVPLEHVRNGQIAYINAQSTSGGGACSPTSRLGAQDVSTDCVTILSAAQVAAIDPCSSALNAATCANSPGFTAPGFDPALLQFINSRYPKANDLSIGDGINTGGFRFNAPNPVSQNIYTTRVDYNLTSKQKMFLRFNFDNADAISTPIAFPGDPLTSPEVLRDRAWVIGHTWAVNPNTVNQFVYGETRNNLDFPITFNPAGTLFPLSWLAGTGISLPFDRQSSSSRIIPLPTFRDDVTLIRGKHSIQFGGLWKPIRTRTTLTNTFDFYSQGLGGAIANLSTAPSDPSLRPANILTPQTLDSSGNPVDPNGTAETNWDAIFTGALGVINEDQSAFTYGKDGTAFPHGAGERRDYRYYDDEVYAQDTWKLRRDLTVTAGLRYQFNSVPYETNGLEATAANTDISQQLADRIANGLNGISGPTATPLYTYSLAGKANGNVPSLYGADKLNFSPRLSLAWNPGFRNGLLGSLLGDHKTVVRLSASQIYDQTAISTVNFIQDQGSFLFGNANVETFGGGGPANSLATDPRFSAINSLPFVLPAPPFQNPVTPFTAGSGSAIQVFGAVNGAFNYGIDPKFHTPYSNVFSFGVQRELAGGLQLEVDYVGRFGRRLFALADGAQLVNFIDPASKHSLAGDGTTLELEARQGLSPTAIAPLPFFENQGGPACLAAAQSFGLSSCTQLAYAENTLNLQQGNIGSMVFGLAQQGFLPQNVGMPAQFAVNAEVSNKGWSSYNGMIVVVRKRLSRNLQFDFDYTLSHSIDNSSLIANNTGNFVGGATTVTCDATDLRVCRGNSEFDVTHQVSSNFIYDLPVGRGQSFGRDVPRWLNEIVGGWQVSGIVTWRTGLAFPVQSGASTTTLAGDAGALFTGNQAAVSSNIHTDNNNNGAIQFFSNPTAAQAAFLPVSGLENGNRDTLRGPHFSNVDLGLSKNFPLFGEKYKLQFRTDAFNAFNHPNFALPNTAVNSSQFGVISSLAGQEVSRVLQFSLRFEF